MKVKADMIVVEVFEVLMSFMSAQSWSQDAVSLA